MNIQKIFISVVVLCPLFIISTISLYSQGPNPAAIAAETASEVVAPPPEETTEAPPRTIALGFQTSGLLGNIGLETNIGIKPSLWFVFGIGGWFSSEGSGNMNITKEYSNFVLLLRWGKTVYTGIGLTIRSRKESESIGPYSVSGKTTAFGIPIVAGIETGNRKGTFLRFEVGYSYYISGDEGQTLTNGPIYIPLPPAGETGMFTGFGFGRYLK